MVTGLCAGIARRYGYDVTLVRALAVIAALSAGVGLVAYLGISAVTPTENSDAVPLDRYWPAWRRLDQTNLWLLLAVAAMVFSMTLGQLSPIGWGPVLLIAIGWLIAKRTPSLFARRTASVPSNSPAPTSMPAPEGAPMLAAGASPATWQVYQAPRPTGPEPAAPPQPSRPEITPRRGRGGVRVLTWTTLAIALLTWLIVFNNTPGPKRLLLASSCALAVVALGLLVGARIGRSALLILAGIGLSLMIALPPVVTRLPAPTEALTAAYQQADDLPADTVVVASSEATLDFSELALASDDTVRVEATAASVRIVVPRQTRLVLTVNSTASVVSLLDDAKVAIDEEFTWTNTPAAAGAAGPTLTVDLVAKGAVVEVTSK